MMVVAEKLSCEFSETEPTTVLRIVDECAAEFPEVDLLFIEQASRARLVDIGGEPGE